MKIYLYRLLLSGTFFCMPLLALVNPVDGENLWRMVERIGVTVDEIFVDQLSIGDVLCSKIEHVDDNLLSIGDVVCSKLEVIEDDLLSVGDVLCSKVEHVDDNLLSIGDVVCSKLEVIEDDLLSVGDVLCSKVEHVDENLLSVGDVLCSKIENIQGSTESVNDLLCSKIEMVDDDLLSVADVICSKIPGDVSSQLDVIEEKIDLIQCPFTITQADIPLTITQPGHYCLLEDVSGTNNLSGLIIIDADDVRLQLASRRITAGPNTAAILVAEDHKRIKIFDGAITHTDIGGTGIFADTGVSGLALDNIHIDCTDLAVNGIVVASSAYNVNIRNSSVVNAAGVGINLLGGDVFNVSNVQVLNAGSSGIQFTDCDNIQCSDCSAKNCDSTGLVINDTTDPFAVVTACVTNFVSTGNGANGYTVLAEVIIMEGCKSIDNTNSGFVITANRMDLTSCTSIEDGDLLATPSADYGFFLRPNATFISMNITDCVAERVPVGFDVIGSGLCMQGCASSNTIEEGFRFGPSSNMLIRDCVANGAVRAYDGQYSLFGAGFHLRGALIGNPPHGFDNRVIGCYAFNCEVGFIIDEDGANAFNKFFDNFAVGSGVEPLIHSYNVNGEKGIVMVLPTGAAVPETATMVPVSSSVIPSIHINLISFT